LLFPHARRRLALDDRRRVALLARRFAPAALHRHGDGAWIALDELGRADLPWAASPDSGGSGMSRLMPDGEVVALEAE